MFDHMLPTTPGAIIGYLKSGKPIRLIAGGAPEGEGRGESQPQGEPQHSGAPDPAGGTQPDPQPSGQPDPLAKARADEQKVNPDAIKVDQLPEWAQKIVRDARKEAGDYRAQLKQAQQEQEEAAKQAGPSADEITAQVREEFAQQIGKALGLVADEQDTRLTPEQVIEKLTAEKEQTAKERDEERELRRRERLEAGVLRASGKLGADSEALLDSRTFLRKIRDLDPDTDDFAANLGDLIQLAIEEHPKYKASALAATPTRSGGEFAGGPGARPSGSEPTTDDFRKRRAVAKEQKSS
ncbi:hypothetical protein FAF44_03065 [Nonomuraea sp. MG754425]|uniref:hypothetical protein n=1 Tax=Nonomuraea sp. MG754425 TaxID=2570319 RepID=UPI001F287589|nr:hypothetical protein [Nonomuraea sp. MG754425]MCF6467396.1 hypothetical protein [Nonomuraea sp. MG754425]